MQQLSAYLINPCFGVFRKFLDDFWEIFGGNSFFKGFEKSREIGNIENFIPLTTKGALAWSQLSVGVPKQFLSSTPSLKLSNFMQNHFFPRINVKRFNRSVERNLGLG